MFKKSLIITTLIISTPVLSSEYEVHVLKKGDTLSEVLQSKGYSPLYGKDNWVDKTLKLNHLKIAQDVEIKKSLPIILPKRARSLTDTVSVKNSSTLRRGLLGNEISNHQEVKLSFGHSQNSTQLPSTSIEQNQNFKIGLDIIGKNNYELSNQEFNLYASLNITSHGSAKIDKKNSVSTRFEPSYQLETGMSIKSPNIDFTVGPTLKTENKTRIEEVDSLLLMRRDTVTLLGVKVQKAFFIDHLEYRTSAGYFKSVIHNDLQNNGQFQTSQLLFDGSVNLTQDYHLGLSASAIQYTGIGINRESSMGLNLIYDLN